MFWNIHQAENISPLLVIMDDWEFGIVLIFLLNFYLFLDNSQLLIVVGPHVKNI